MSFIKIQRIDPTTISNPDPGHVYVGQDGAVGFGGFWQKDEWGNIYYLGSSGNTYIITGATYNITGITYIISGSTSSGTSGLSGIDGTSGTSGFGTAGTSGKSGLSGSYGTSGSSGSGGTSGTSGNTGTAGTAGTSGWGTSGSSGFSGSSGVDGNFLGSSGTSGFSGYGGATRVWTFSSNTIPSDGYFYGIGSGGFDMGLLDEIRLNKKDSESVNLINWLSTWGTGIIKIENINDLSNSSVYHVNNIIPYTVGNVVIISGITAYNAGGSLIEGEKYFISYVPAGFGTAGTSGVGSPGTSGTSGVGSPGSGGSSGTSGVGSPGSSGTSGITGTSGISGSSGSSACTISFTPNSGVEYVSGGTCGEVHTIYNTLLDPTLTVPNAVGGITSGTAAGDLSGKTLVSLIDDLLFPTVLPTYTIPVITLSSSVTGIIEVGVQISPLLTLDGTKNDASGYTSLSIVRGVTTLATTSSPVLSSATAIASQFGYVDPNNPNSKYTLTHTDSGYTIPVQVTTSPSSTVYGGNGNYSSGLAKKNNKGNFDVRSFAVRSVNAPQSGSTNFNSSTITISGYYPYFFGKSGTTMTAAQVVTLIQSGLVGYTKVVNTVNSSVNMAFNAVGEWPWFVTFTSYTNRSTWAEVGNPLNNGLIGTNGTDLFAAPVTLPINSPSGYWSGVSFKIYVSQKVTTLANCTIT